MAITMQHHLPREIEGAGKRFHSLDSRFDILRAAKFGIAGAVGFLVAELIIILGLYSIYGNANIPSEIYSSPVLLVLNIIAFVVGVTIGFFINEQITVHNVGKQGERSDRNIAIRLLRYQGVYAIGNAITIGIQLVLLKSISLSPAIGNVVGAIVAFPVSYFFSMRIVWGVPPTVSRDDRSSPDSGKSAMNRYVSAKIHLIRSLFFNLEIKS